MIYGQKIPKMPLPIQAIPKYFFFSGLAGLTDLHLSQNLLEQLPDSIGKNLLILIAEVYIFQPS